MTTETEIERPSLTAKQAAFLKYMVENQTLCGPTVREMCKAFNIKSPNGVQCHIIALERKGYIRRRNRKARGIEVLR